MGQLPAPEEARAPAEDGDAVPLLHRYLSRSAARLPEKVALVRGAERVTYADLETRSDALARWLVARGAQRGDRVIVFLENSVEAVVSFWAVLRAGCVVSVVNPLTKAEKLAYVLNDCRASFLVAGAPLAHVFLDAASRSPHLRSLVVVGDVGGLPATGGLPVPVAWEAALAEGRAAAPVRTPTIDIDLASIVYTSGTTGDPKGVMLTHRNMLTAATSVSAYLGIREDDVVLCALPLSFDYGLYQTIMAFRAGARVVLEPSFAFPAEVMSVVVAERVTAFPGVPTVFALLAEMKSLRQLDLSSVRMVTNTAAALSLRQIAAIREIFPGARVFSMFGLTECKRCTYVPPEDLDRKPGSVGIAIPNTELWLVDEDDRRVGPGELGQLVIRGATVMRGYWEKPEETAKMLRPGPLPGESVLYTGDLCRMDEEGYLYFVGRMDDVIKSRGEKVAPKEIESVINDLPGVRESAVVGVPDEVLGQALRAFVVLEAGAQVSARDVQRGCQRRLESFLVPKFVEFVPDLPKTASGKIRKTGLGGAPPP